MNNQEKLWSGRFGDEYTMRQKISRIDTEVFFIRALDGTMRTSLLNTVIEFGANTGHNLQAIAELFEDSCSTTGVEINDAAWEKLKDVADVAVNASILDMGSMMFRGDLAFTKGLLIHIHPGDLPCAYRTLYDASSRYILIAEYFNPTPVEVKYRDHDEALWKRDFGGDMLDTFPDLDCIDYGFVWSRDKHPQDNLTWWLFEK